MSDTPETIAAIIAEMRDERIIRLDGADVTRCLLHNLADRIEAAAERERAITDIMLAVKDKPLPHPDPDNAPPLFFPTKTQLRTLSDLVAIAHDEMDGLPYHEQELERFDSLLFDMKARYAFDKPYAATGNAAAMRAALTAFVGYLTQKRIDEVWAKTTLPEPGLDRLVEQARAALATPARNCDRFKALDEAREAFQDLRGHKILADVELWDSMDEAGALVRWLFSPAEDSAQ